MSFTTKKYGDLRYRYYELETLNVAFWLDKIKKAIKCENGCLISDSVHSGGSCITSSVSLKTNDGFRTMEEDFKSSVSKDILIDGTLDGVPVSVGINVPTKTVYTITNEKDTASAKKLERLLSLQ